MYKVLFGDVFSSDLGLILYDYPEIERGTQGVEFINVLGREEALTVKQASRSNTKIKCTFTAITKNAHHRERLDEKVRQWTEQTGELRISEFLDRFFKVKHAYFEKAERESRKVTRYIVTFECSPFIYLDAGKFTHTIAEASINPYERSAPLYKIKGNGTCFLKVNGKTIKAIVEKELSIDTELMIAYNEAGAPAQTAITGDYESGHLERGKNTITVTNGFSVEILPRWRQL